LGIYHQKVPTIFDSQIVRSFDPVDRSTLGRQPSNSPYLIKANLKNLDEIDKVVDVCLARFGRIDLLVNAAADIRFHGELNYARKYLTGAQDQILLNAITPIVLASAFAENFWKHKCEENRRSNRNIINVSSISGLNIYPGFGQGFYSASKAALNFLTCHLASEYETIGLRANAVCPASFPGTIATETVVDEIIKIDHSMQSGKVFALDERGVRAMN
jgi:NAD(P)-dependent dehydrogenase (short-subunit alcohol dehydrogenase family)